MGSGQKAGEPDHRHMRIHQLGPGEQKSRDRVRSGGDHWGQGYITETVNQVIDYGCRSMELNRIEGMCDAEN
ncbi:MAG TPA: N-acetyltransferase [Dehalococcoidia bacterium]|nr:N-acetyltransferase [Dehalococcoidia bacterium]